MNCVILLFACLEIFQQFLSLDLKINHHLQSGDVNRLQMLVNRIVVLTSENVIAGEDDAQGDCGNLVQQPQLDSLQFEWLPS